MHFDILAARNRALVVIAAVLLALSGRALMGQSAGPQPTPMPPPVPAPQDRPYGGTLQLSVDATDTARHIFGVRETIPVQSPGPMILLYPQWIPGHHAPNGPVQELSGLVLHANGQRIEWVRDPVDVFAFHVDVPTGTALARFAAATAFGDFTAAYLGIGLGHDPGAPRPGELSH